MFKIILILSSTLLFFSCGEPNRLNITIPNDSKVNLKIYRFEKEFFEADKYKLKELNEQWINTYGILYESFIFQMLNEGSVHDPMITYRLEKFLNDSTMQSFYREINAKFNDFSSYKVSLQDAFSRYKYYFKDSAVPNIITFYSNFNAKAFPMNNRLGIGLDMYLGADNKLIKGLPYEFFPAYLKNKMEPKYLVSETIKYWLYYKFSKRKDFQNYAIYIIKDDFLNTIIHHGKMMYLLDAMLPNTSMEIKFCYSKEDLKWCKENEYHIYQNLIEQNLIYTKSHKDIVKYVNNGPFTNGLSEESPSMIGVWMGYQMVKDYMDKNPNVTISELIYKETSSRKILRAYRP